MNKIICSVLLCAAALTVDAQSTPLPYSSDLGVNYGIDPAWTHVNANRRATGFTYDRDSDYSTPGTSGGIQHAYDSSYDANCWVFSPAFDLKAGETYTVGIWAKTKGADAENFMVCYGDDMTAAAMTVTLLDKKYFKSPDDFTHFEESFTVDADQTVYVGIKCYSYADSYILSLTGFTLSGEGGGGGEDPVIPDDPEALPLPFEYTFDTPADFASKWTTYAGPDAYTQSPWKINSYSGWAVFDVAEYEKEDNWVISPLLSFASAGSYSLTYKGLISGKLEFLIGTDASDVSTFTLIATEETDSYDNDTEYTYVFDVAEAGNYHIAVRAAADAGSFMGYRMKTLSVRSDKAVPAIVDDLTAIADANDGLEVNIMWTNPAVDHKGQPLESITKIELYRNGQMIKDSFLTLSPGGINAWLDTPEASGMYGYHVVVYNENGCAATPARVVNAGFVGHPMAELPYDYEPESTDMFDLFTVVDANEDGCTWQFTADKDYTFWNKLELKSDALCQLDDYLVTPYFALEAGYYSLTISANMRSNSIELGYVTNRHNPEATFVKFDAVDNYDEYSLNNHRRVFAIDKAGEYALCVHAVGQSTSSSDLTIAIKEVIVDYAQQLPGAVTDFKATDLEPAEGFAVELAWFNPSIDNAGVAMSADTPLTATVSRNGSIIATLDGDDCLPGAAMTYTDTDIVAAGNYTYTVAIASANGASEDAPASVTLYIGPSVQLPYATLDFSQWQFADPDNYYNWEINTDGTATWEKSWGHSNYTIFTPYIRINNDMQYKLNATFDGREDYSMDMNLMSAFTLDENAVSVCHSFTVPAEAVDHELSLILVPGTEPAAPRVASNDDTDLKANVPSGKLVLGFRPAETGKITLKSFSLTEHSTVGVDATLVASQGTLFYAGGVVSCAQAVRITVCDTAGHILMSVFADRVDLSHLSGAGCVLVSAPGHKALKIVL